jgi:uncharacterized protein YaaQ
MSKLLVAIVHHDDAGPARDALRRAGHRFTELPSVGGFLGEANATFLFGVEDDAEPSIVAIFEDVSHGRDIEVPLVLTERLADWKARTVSHGGATIFVADLARIIRI